MDLEIKAFSELDLEDTFFDSLKNQSWGTDSDIKTELEDFKRYLIEEAERYHETTR